MKRKNKEIQVRDFINQHFDGFIHDKSLELPNCNCTHRRRIDFRKFINSTLVCIEVDEYAHRAYNKKDENEIRYNDLYLYFSCNYIFIRFNPDKYKNKNGVTIESSLESRLDTLKDEIEKQIKRAENYENKENLEIIYLFYDE